GRGARGGGAAGARGVLRADQPHGLGHRRAGGGPARRAHPHGARQAGGAEVPDPGRSEARGEGPDRPRGGRGSRAPSSPRRPEVHPRRRGQSGQEGSVRGSAHHPRRREDPRDRVAAGRARLRERPMKNGSEKERRPEPAGHPSLEGMHSTVPVPHHSQGFFRQWRAFVGPAILVSVGYMDPGNWGTDLQAGAQFRYGLLWVVALASLMAIFMQVIAARLGVVTGKDLAQCCRDWYPKWTRWPNWLLSEIAIGACDLAEVLGSAVALNLLFHIPLLWAVVITG